MHRAPVVDERDGDGDGSVDASETYTYDAEERLLNPTADDDADGIADEGVS